MGAGKYVIVIKCEVFTTFFLTIYNYHKENKFANMSPILIFEFCTSSSNHIQSQQHLQFDSSVITQIGAYCLF